MRPAAVASGKHSGHRPYLRLRITVFEVWMTPQGGLGSPRESACSLSVTIMSHENPTPQLEVATQGSDS